VLLDVLYDPWPAPVAALVQRVGGEVADGLEMLAHPADMQVRSMLHVPSAPVVEMLAAARAELARRRGGAR
jgi:shikimate dehydrogenase